jgi:hypothetical protein
VGGPQHDEPDDSRDGEGRDEDRKENPDLTARRRARSDIGVDVGHPGILASFRPAPVTGWDGRG